MKSITLTDKGFDNLFNLARLLYWMEQTKEQKQNVKDGLFSEMADVLMESMQCFLTETEKKAMMNTICLKKKDVVDDCPCVYCTNQRGQLFTKITKETT